MNYTEVKIFISKDYMEPLTYALSGIGIGGFVVEDPEIFQEFLQKKNEYDWDYVDEKLYDLQNISSSISFYIEDTEEGLEILDKVTYICQDFPLDGMEIGYVKEDDWKEKWKEYFKPIRVTKNLVIKPGWDDYQRERDSDIIINIDPGMAFGTGTHPTTILCLQALERYIVKGNTKLLDVGCGSAILSIAGAFLGSVSVVGIDIDPEAVRIARENVLLNGLSEKIVIEAGDLTEGILGEFNLVVANLMADLVIMLSKEVSNHLTEEGIYISSGILIEKKEEVVSCMAEHGFKVLDIMEKEEWCAIVAQK
ncbi:MAG: 50S ribosomal protein L11 methyltransferase [Anaerovoracaceae bacterium]|jgi:ribosomal protein L11 methyltransferase